jgi:tartrate dehydratase alpha subunit/fumarate hydratase class I-like protein
MGGSEGKLGMDRLPTSARLGIGAVGLGGKAPAIAVKLG